MNLSIRMMMADEESIVGCLERANDYNSTSVQMEGNKCSENINLKTDPPSGFDVLHQKSARSDQC
jgi:hypothetical protein